MYTVAYVPSDEISDLDVANNSGWSAALRWMSSLDRSKYPHIHNFASNNSTESCRPLSVELELALRRHAPGPDVARVVRRLIENIDGRPNGTTGLYVTN